MPWYIYLALRQIFPRGRLVSPFFLLSVLGVTLGVMILIIVQSVMGGFGQTYRELIVDTNGHLRVETGGVDYRYRETVERLREDPAIRAAAPFAQGVVMLQHRQQPAFPYIRGIEPWSEGKVIPLDDFMIRGSLDDLHDDSILLSSVLARQLRADVGATVDVYTPLMLDQLKEDEVLLPRELRVAGIYETGWNQFDSTTMVATLRLMQDLYAMEGGAHGIAVRVNPGVDEFQVAQRLNEELGPPYRAVTWTQMYEDFLWVLQLEKSVMFFLLLFIVLVAAFAIAISMLLTVLRKTREIGLIGAMGGGARNLAASYCFQGFFIGVCGSIAGTGLALLALRYRDEIVSAFATVTGSRDVLIQFYQFAHLPAHYNPRDFVIIIAAALLLSTAAGFLPAFRAARLKPAEALRHE